MCGRYAASADLAELILEFDVVVDATREPSRSILVSPQTPPAGTPDFNMAPTKQAPVVLARPDRQARLLTWGLVPSWSKDVRGGARMINARAETLLDKPAFARAARSRRCLVPAAGWYEWQVVGGGPGRAATSVKQPWFVGRRDGHLLAMAGIYEFWRDRTVAEADDPDAWLATFSIVTTAAAPGLDRIHDRQPVVLDRAHWEDWLDPGLTDEGHVAALLHRVDASVLRAHPVSDAVSSNRSVGRQLMLPISSEVIDGERSGAD